MHKITKNEKGQSLVEFALVLPLLISIFIAIVAFSMFGFTWLQASESAHNAAHEAAIAIVDETETSCEMRALMGRGFPKFIGVENEVFYTSANCTSDPYSVVLSGEEITATWEFDFNPPVAFIYDNFDFHVVVTAYDHSR